MAETCRVVVVGGGLAGLAAARMLAQHFGNDDVVLLEAASSLGGRIKHVNGLVPWPVEVGPEFIHGTKNSSVKIIADEMGCQMRELPYHRYYLGLEHRMLTSVDAEEHKEIQLVHELFQAIAAEDPDAPDISMAEYLRRQNVSHTVTQLAQSIYANDFGCSLEQLGVRECIQEAKHWIYGDSYLILDRPLSSIIDYLAQDLKLSSGYAEVTGKCLQPLNAIYDVNLDSPVQMVEYSTEGVKVQGRDGCILMADYAILTVPVKILKDGYINFAPALPPSKLKAIESIGMNNCLKVMLAFSERFWPEDLFDVVCTDCFLPEIWVTQYPPSLHQATGKPPLGQFIVVGFLAGELAVAAARLPEAEIIIRSLSQLDDMFRSTMENTGERGGWDEGFRLVEEPSGTSNDLHKFLRPEYLQAPTNDPQCAILRPATSSFRGGCVINWENELFVRGGYTYPSMNAHGARAILAEPILGRVFFAGEATHPGVNPCMQGAIDTGRRAANEILNFEIHSRF